MKATIIFDNVNDILFSKWDESFLQRMKSLSDQGGNDNITDSYNVAQLLSPIITSQRVMAAQFGNTYTSMQCKDDTTIVFDEWLDHVFIIISKEKVDDAHRELMDCKTFVQHICGQNIHLLNSPVYQEWLTQLLESRTKGEWIPGASGIIGKSGATAAALGALKTAAKDIKCSHSHYHLMIFVGDKLLALYSSRGSEDLTPPDLILLSVQCIAAQEFWNELEKGDDTKDGSPHIPWLSEQNSGVVHSCAGASLTPSAPHSLHLAQLAPRITFAVLVDMELREMGVLTAASNQILSNLKKLLLQRNLELLPSTIDSLESSLKKLSDTVRKSKVPSRSQIASRVSERVAELRRAANSSLAAENAAAALQAILNEVIDALKPDIPSLRLDHPLKELQNILAPYVDFLRVKAMRYFGLGSESATGSLTLHKYVEEFPGLVHFIYIDRTAGRVLQPDLQDCSDMLTKEMIRDIVSRALSVSREGYGGCTWRRGALHTCCVWWWQRRGAPAAPAAPPPRAAARALPPPADITTQFTRQLTELAFPNDSQGVSMKELICVHLGLVPASTAVQQARRLAHSVPEIAGDNPALANDLL